MRITWPICGLEELWIPFFEYLLSVGAFSSALDIRMKMEDNNLYFDNRSNLNDYKMFAWRSSGVRTDCI